MCCSSDSSGGNISFGDESSKDNLSTGSKSASKDSFIVLDNVGNYNVVILQYGTLMGSALTIT